MISVPIDWAEAVQITDKAVSRHPLDNHDQPPCQLLFVLSITRLHPVACSAEATRITTRFNQRNHGLGNLFLDER